MKAPETTAQAADRLLAARTSITAAELASAAGVTRQAAQRQLARMVRSGLLTVEGKARATRYLQNVQRASSYELVGLTEDAVWGAEKLALRSLDPEIEDAPNVISILNFAFTEMVNNVIDHSKGTHLNVRWFLSDDVSFEVEDDGIGAFVSIRQARGLPDDFQAIGELSKGKQTTDPARHSGLGIFLTSKIVDRFVLTANEYSWTVSKEIGNDFAVRGLDRPRKGTLVRCEIRRDTDDSLQKVMARYTSPETKRLDRTTLRVELFQGGGEFVSRTEAKAIGASLEGFDVIELDFTGVEQIGQGFADQLFRVWLNDHPTARLVPVNANRAIMAMIDAVKP